jgi:hypothetical protein
MMKQKEVIDFFESLVFQSDGREYPDERRRGRFKAGWEDATVRLKQ